MHAPQLPGRDGLRGAGGVGDGLARDALHTAQVRVALAQRLIRRHPHHASCFVAWEILSIASWLICLYRP